ncbi:MAG: right-handed parallel beta-helix repeat-containing protein [Nitriliruptorales bacterium]|nr:right-handed parallel beta-helix repeat-containing protein [Nitriliruptorales bacterium]
MTNQLRLAIAVAVGALTIAAVAGIVVQPEPLVVSPGDDLVDVAERHPGATLQLEPGVHRGGSIETPVRILGGADVTVLGPLEIRADGVEVHDLHVAGGDNGILVRDVDGVLLKGIRSTGAELHGIEVVDSTVRIEGCEISGLEAERAQGIEIRNAAGRGRSLITGCTVSGGQEGIVTHVSRAELHDNVVTGTTLRAISILEMSEVLATGNHVEGVTGSAIFCGDMSTCDVQRNRVRDVRSATNGIRNQSGQAAIVWYYSGLRLLDNDFEVTADPAIDAYNGGVLTDRSPLGVWPEGWQGLLTGLPLSLAALGAFGLVFLAVRWLLRRQADSSLVSEPRDSRAWTVSDGVYALVVAGFAVQSFHMLEHLVQVIQVEVIDAEIRAGLLGQQFNTEWLHFVYNVAVLAFLVAIWRVGRGSTRSLSGASTAAAWFGAGIVAQIYHTFEHTVKIVQRIATGVDPAPGLFGDDLGLVWFHFAINLVVHLGATVGVVAIVLERRREREQQEDDAQVAVPA